MLLVRLVRDMPANRKCDRAIKLPDLGGLE